MSREFGQFAQRLAASRRRDESRQPRTMRQDRKSINMLGRPNVSSRNLQFLDDRFHCGLNRFSTLTQLDGQFSFTLSVAK